MTFELQAEDMNEPIEAGDGDLYKLFQPNVFGNDDYLQCNEANMGT